MVEADRDYLRRLLRADLVTGPVLELGVGYGGVTCRDLIEAHGLAYHGTDRAPADGVDFVADFERRQDLAVFRPVAPFGSVLVLNVLEHTFDPIGVLDNARTLLRPGGVLVVVTPAVWPLHDYPLDVWRVLPNFYEEYARRRGLDLPDEHFAYVGFGPVRAFRQADGAYKFPPAFKRGLRHWIGKTFHKVFDTFGPRYIAVGAVLVERKEKSL